MAHILKKPHKSTKQPEVGRLLSRVYKMTLRHQSVTTKTRGKKDRLIKAEPKAAQKRDKYGRFVKVSRLGLAKRNPDRLRDKNGRFIARASQPIIYRDKHGRFARQSQPWFKRRYATLLPIVLGIIGAIFFGYQLNKPIVVEEPVAASQVQKANTQEPQISEVTVVLPRSEPTQLRIPKIAVNTSFTQIGKKPDGSIEVPKQHSLVGWYSLSPTPGELGPAVVVGHVDRPGGPAVFWRLRELVPGDTFEIDRADSSTVKFRVDVVKQLPQNDFPTEEVYGNLNYAGIRLITCGGTFNRTTRSYSHNTVVYGSLIVEETKISQSTN